MVFQPCSPEYDGDDVCSIMGAFSTLHIMMSRVGIPYF